MLDVTIKPEVIQNAVASLTEKAGPLLDHVLDRLRPEMAAALADASDGLEVTFNFTVSFKRKPKEEKKQDVQPV